MQPHRDPPPPPPPQPTQPPTSSEMRNYLIALQYQQPVSRYSSYRSWHYAADALARAREARDRQREAEQLRRESRRLQEQIQIQRAQNVRRYGFTATRDTPAENQPSEDCQGSQRNREVVRIFHGRFAGTGESGHGTSNTQYYFDEEKVFRDDLERAKQQLRQDRVAAGVPNEEIDEGELVWDAGEKLAFENRAKLLENGALPRKHGDMHKDVKIQGDIPRGHGSRGKATVRRMGAGDAVCGPQPLTSQQPALSSSFRSESQIYDGSRDSYNSLPRFTDPDTTTHPLQGSTRQPLEPRSSRGNSGRPPRHHTSRNLLASPYSRPRTQTPPQLARHSSSFSRAFETANQGQFTAHSGPLESQFPPQHTSLNPRTPDLHQGGFSRQTYSQPFNPHRPGITNTLTHHQSQMQAPAPTSFNLGVNYNPLPPLGFSQLPSSPFMTTLPDQMFVEQPQRPQYGSPASPQPQPYVPQHDPMDIDHLPPSTPQNSPSQTGQVYSLYHTPTHPPQSPVYMYPPPPTTYLGYSISPVQSNQRRLGSSRSHPSPHPHMNMYLPQAARYPEVGRDATSTNQGQPAPSQDRSPSR